MFFGETFLRAFLRGWLLAVCVVAPFPAIGQEPPPGGQEPATGQPYEDQLIDPDVEPDPPADELSLDSEELPWVAGATYRFGLRDDDNSRTTEHALELHYEQDTANWGRLRLDVLGRHGENGPLRAADRSDGQFTLTQTGFPVASGWLADSGLGVQRTVSDPLVESSYRFYLPSSIVNGFTTAIGNEEQEFRLTWGDAGRVEGLFTRSFESDETRLVGAGYSRELNDAWRLAAEFWQAEPDGPADDTRSLATAAEYSAPDELASHGIHALTDDDGDTGVWYDGFQTASDWDHHFGVFALAPDLEWQDRVVANDRDGAYYRVDYHRLTAVYNAGVDVARTRTTNSTDTRLFGGARWRLGLRRSVGAQLSYGALDPPETDLAPEPVRTLNHDWRASVYYTHATDSVDNRIELRTTGVEAEQDERRYELSLDQFWTTPSLEGLITRLELERRESEVESGDEIRAGLTYRRQFPGSISLDAGILLIHQRREDAADSTGGNLNFNLNWPFHDNWSVGVNAVYNRNVVPDPLAPMETETLQGNQVMVTLSWGRSGGRLPGVLGAGNAEKGIGRLSGYVYYDENRDGRRSPGEDGVEGVVVRLDGVVTAITDQQGRFEYWPVAAGTHRVGVSVESVPLPWEPIGVTTVTVQPRGETYNDLPLQRINE